MATKEPTETKIKELAVLWKNLKRLKIDDIEPPLKATLKPICLKQNTLL